MVTKSLVLILNPFQLGIFWFPIFACLASTQIRFLSCGTSATSLVSCTLVTVVGCGCGPMYSLATYTKGFWCSVETVLCFCFFMLRRVALRRCGPQTLSCTAIPFTQWDVYLSVRVSSSLSMLSQVRFVNTFGWMVSKRTTCWFIVAATF